MRSVVIAITLAFLGALAAPNGAAAPAISRGGPALEPVPSPQVRLEVVVLTKNDKGRVYCALWSGPAGYPTDRDRVVAETHSPYFAGGKARLELWVETRRDYALACFHDENDNRAFDRNFLGIPSEGFGASRDARGFMGPPRYEDARFQVDGPTTVTLRMSYL